SARGYPAQERGKIWDWKITRRIREDDRLVCGQRLRYQQPSHVLGRPGIGGRVQTFREAEVPNSGLSGWNRVVPKTFGMCDDEDPCRRGRRRRRGGGGGAFALAPAPT